MDFNNSDFIKAAKDAFNKTFGLKTEVDMESKIAKAEKNEPETEKKEEIDIKNTWVWVEGYKGTDKNMCCNDYQYTFGQVDKMPREEVKECASGFHMCLTMRDVFKYYPIGKGNRYFKVRALVRLSDKNEYGIGGGMTYSYYSLPQYTYSDARNKLVAAEIEFLEELSMDEILSNTRAVDWEPKYKEMAIKIGLDAADNTRKTDILTGYGYSLPFANYLVNNKKYDVAKAVGSQPDLSMDMKCLMILQG